MPLREFKTSGKVLRGYNLWLSVFLTLNRSLCFLILNMIKRIVISIFFLSATLIGMTQTKPLKPVSPASPSDTAKIIYLKAKLGPMTGSAPVLVNDFLKLQNSDLIIQDQYGTEWKVIAFRFAWNRKEVNDDWKTGKSKTIMSYNATEVTDSTKIPIPWQNEIKLNLQAGEQIMFEQIIAENKKTGRKRFAPDFQITLIEE